MGYHGVQQRCINFWKQGHHKLAPTSEALSYCFFKHFFVVWSICAASLEEKPSIQVKHWCNLIMLFFKPFYLFHVVLGVISLQRVILQAEPGTQIPQGNLLGTLSANLTRNPAGYPVRLGAQALISRPQEGLTGAGSGAGQAQTTRKRLWPSP